MRVNGRAVVLVDGLKRPKEGKKMPGVKSLHQESRCNAKASFIMGHSLQAVAMLAHVAGGYMAVPVAARIHEGVVWSNRDRRTLLDKLSALLVGLPWDQPATVVADAYYAAAKFARALLQAGHHLVTRVRSNAVAYFPAPPRQGKRRGRRAIYGRKTKLRDWFHLDDRFIKAPSPVYGESKITLRYYSYDRKRQEWCRRDEPRLTPLQRNCCAYAGLAGLGFQRLGSTSLTSWFFMEGKRPSTSVRYSCGLMPRRRQL